MGFVAIPAISFGETDAQRKARIEQELQNVERQILKQQVLVEDKQLERQSLERDLDIIDAEVTKAQLGIQARSVAINQLTNQIGDRAVAIEILTARLETQRQSLSELIRETQEVDDFSLIEILLSNKNFSEFFEDFESFRAVNESLKSSLNVLEEIKFETELQKNSLEEKKLTEAEMKYIQELQKQEIEHKEREKEQILTVTKGEEEQYQTLLDSQRKTAGQLRNSLFELLGDGGGIPFPEAVRLSQYASGVTGVDAALILAILEQETNLGSNLGSCVFTDNTSSRPIMHPDRDEPVFLAIAQVLGFDPYARTVSCPIIQNGSRVGWGGAMGPSQFIPSTWAIYGGIVNKGSGWTYNQSSDAIRYINSGSGPSNPFNNQDAFIATALLLRDNGANSTYAGDRLAALRYYSGWGGATNPANYFYGDQVMNRKSRLAREIQILGGS
jgi:hypothetical protein